MKTRKNNAFTLAEVLITIGIIGIVAALTIPNLMGEYRKKVAETRLARFYSVMNQAIIQSEAVNGPKEYWDKLENGYEENEDGTTNYSASLPMQWFNKYLRPYLKLLDVQIETESSSGIIAAYFPDGSVARICASSFQFWVSADYYRTANFFNEDGTRRNAEEISGTKYFTFFFSPWSSTNQYYYRKGVEPYKYSWDGTREMLLNNSRIGCKKGVSNERAYCAALIQMNGWKIPDDYPLKF